MKRKIALKNLKRTCVVCNRNFKKGEVYYIKRVVFNDDGLYAQEYLQCPKCLHKEKERMKRFEKFKITCNHSIINDVWGFIAGECVKEPKYSQCALCRKILY